MQQSTPTPKNIGPDLRLNPLFAHTAEVNSELKPWKKPSNRAGRSTPVRMLRKIPTMLNKRSISPRWKMFSSQSTADDAEPLYNAP